MFRKHFTIFNIAIFAALLFSIKGGMASSHNAATSHAEDKHYVVAFSQDTMRNDWRVAQVRELRDALAKYPFIEFKYSDAQGSAANQVLDIERFISEKVDVIVTSPADASATAPVVSSAYKSGIPVVLLSRSVETEDYTTFITGDNYAIGKSAAEFIAKSLNGNANILMLEGISTSSTAQARGKGFVDGVAKYPGMKIVYKDYADYLRGKAIEVVDAALAGGIQFDAIYAHSDSMASGARMALKNAGISPSKILTVGIDYISETKAAIISGNQAASFTYPTYGKEGAEYIVKILAGETVPKNVVVHSVLITNENVNEIEPIF